MNHLEIPPIRAADRAPHRLGAGLRHSLGEIDMVFARCDGSSRLPAAVMVFECSHPHETSIKR